MTIPLRDSRAYTVSPSDFLSIEEELPPRTLDISRQALRALDPRCPDGNGGRPTSPLFSNRRSELFIPICGLDSMRTLAYDHPDALHLRNLRRVRAESPPLYTHLQLKRIGHTFDAYGKIYWKGRLVVDLETSFSILFIPALVSSLRRFGAERKGMEEQQLNDTASYLNQAVHNEQYQ